MAAPVLNNLGKEFSQGYHGLSNPFSYSRADRGGRRKADAATRASEKHIRQGQTLVDRQVGGQDRSRRLIPAACGQFLCEPRQGVDHPFRGQGHADNAGGGDENFPRGDAQLAGQRRREVFAIRHALGADAGIGIAAVDEYRPYRGIIFQHPFAPQHTGRSGAIAREHAGGGGGGL